MYSLIIEQVHLLISAAESFQVHYLEFTKKGLNEINKLLYEHMNIFAVI
jgi:hypothetical protein